jgi:TonB C terminal
MSREAHIPLALWICAAIVAHLAGGKSATEVSEAVQDSAELRALTRSVRQQLRPPDTTFEVITELAPTAPAPVATPPEDPPDDKVDPNAEPDPNEPKPPPPKKPEPPKSPPPKSPPPKSPPPKKLEPPKPPPPKVEELKPAVPIVKAPPPPPEMDRRLAVKQNVKKDQLDNPSASRIADDANQTDEETVARIRAFDQDDPNPSPGAHAGPPSADPGNADHDKLADSDEHKGNDQHAPGEANPTSTEALQRLPRASAPPAPVARGNLPRSSAASPPGPKEAASAPGGAGPVSPEVVSGDQGTYTLDPANPGGDGKSRSPGRKRKAMVFNNPVHPSETGLNRGGPFNLTSDTFERAVGQEQLRAERAADGAARRSAHLGSMETNKFDRLRAAIENYEPSVKLGNQTSLNAARVPFATYINAIHNRLHPIFAEEFLGLAESHPNTTFNDMNLVTHIEIVLNKEQGRIVRLGVTRASGVTAFDIAAVTSVSRAEPFGKAPDEIVSPDGNVYLHWEFHRDPVDACTTRNARPFLLKEAPSKPMTPAPPRRPAPGPRGDDRSPAQAPLLPLRGQ